LILVVADDGIGLVTDQLQSKRDGFGHSLIRAFKDKLEADIEIISNGGTMIRLNINSYKSIL